MDNSSGVAFVCWNGRPALVQDIRQCTGSVERPVAGVSDDGFNLDELAVCCGKSHLRSDHIWVRWICDNHLRVGGASRFVVRAAVVCDLLGLAKEAFGDVYCLEVFGVGDVTGTDGFDAVDLTGGLGGQICVGSSC